MGYCNPRKKQVRVGTCDRSRTLDFVEPALRLERVDDLAPREMILHLTQSEAKKRDVRKKHPSLLAQERVYGPVYRLQARVDEALYLTPLAPSVSVERGQGSHGSV